MELRHLKYFVAVAEELNFRRAAEVVHVAQPALSQQIKQLEEELGVKLLARNQHKVELTPAGRAFYERAQQILKAAQQAAQAARAAELGDVGTLRIGFVSAAAISVLPRLLALIREQIPLAEVELDELAPGEQIDALYRDTLDLGLFHARLEDATFETAVVSRERLMAALPRANALARQPAVALPDLARETVIMPARHATSGYFERVRAAFQAAGASLERVHHTRLLQTGLLLVGAGVGVSLVPESFQRIQVKGLVYRPLVTEAPTIDLLAAWRRDNASPLLARVAHEIRAYQTALLDTIRRD